MSPCSVLHGLIVCVLMWEKTNAMQYCNMDGSESNFTSPRWLAGLCQ